MPVQCFTAQHGERGGNGHYVYFFEKCFVRCRFGSRTYKASQAMKARKGSLSTFVQMQGQRNTSAIVREAQKFMLIYAVSLLPSFNSFCNRNLLADGKWKLNIPNIPKPSLCHAEHVCGFFGTWDRCL
jgi:hypothetical protein